MRITIDRNKVRQDAITDAVPRLDRVGARTLGVVRPRTPVDTEKLRKSEHYTVIGPDGQVLAGMTTDDNGNAVPNYTGNGMVRVIIASNEGADDGEWYGFQHEIGAGGKPGLGFFAAGYGAMGEIVRSEFER